MEGQGTWMRPESDLGAEGMSLMGRAVTREEGNGGEAWKLVRMKLKLRWCQGHELGTE